MSVFRVILVRIFPHLDWIRKDTEIRLWENADQNNSEYGHFSCSGRHGESFIFAKYKTKVIFCKYFFLTCIACRYVSKSWGYFLWSNRFLYISTDGTETSPRIPYTYPSRKYLRLRSVVNGNEVKIYINDIFIQKVELEGKEANSMTHNYVGLWCHRLTGLSGKGFQVKECKMQFFNFSSR